MENLVVFAHGKESGPWGSKILRLADIAKQFGANVLSPDYTDLPSPDGRVAHLLALDIPARDQLVLVGSSMGGYVSTVASQSLKPTGLFLMAPAFYLPGYGNQHPETGAAHTVVIHGWHDEVIPTGSSIRFTHQHECALHLLPGDHRLTDALPDIAALFEDFLGRTLGWRAGKPQY